MNKGFYKDLDTNFEQALEMSKRDFPHETLIEMLKHGNIPEKQLAALRIEDVNNLEEAQILVSNLTGCDGKIREAVALKINNLLIKSPALINFFTQPEDFANASIDINANICRVVIDSVSILKENKEFAKFYLDKILKFIAEAYEELDKFVFRDKKYVINKQLFKLYWCLEALKLFAKDLDTKTLFTILDKASKEREYTIREKVAQIVVKLNSNDFNSIEERLKQDDNYYVRNTFK